MNTQQLAYLHFVIDQANAADMDIGVSTNVIATLLAAYERVLAERQILHDACDGARPLIRIIDSANPGSFSVGAVLITLDQALDR